MFRDAVGDALHYGSVFTMSDYESKIHNAYFTANFVPVEDLMIFGSVAFNKARGALDEVIMPDVEDRLEGELEDQDFTFEEMPAYSEIDFELVNWQLGFEYKLTPEVTWTTDGMYGSLWDYSPYVYGDESGSVFVIRSGIRFEF